MAKLKRLVALEPATAPKYMDVFHLLVKSAEIPSTPKAVSCGPYHKTQKICDICKSTGKF